MIISHEHRYIFIKTHKTAGTSVEIALSRFCGSRDVITPISSEDEDVRQETGGRGAQNVSRSLAHYSIRDWGRLILKAQPAPPFKKHLPGPVIRGMIPRNTWDSYFKFTIERNPWDKTISAFYWRNIVRQRDGKPELTLGEFLRSGVINEYCDWGRYADNSGIIVDEVLQYSDLNAGLESIRSRFGFPNLTLPNAKGSYRQDRRPHWEVLGAEERDQIADVFRREIAAFGYAFGPPVPA